MARSNAVFCVCLYVRGRVQCYSVWPTATSVLRTPVCITSCMTPLPMQHSATVSQQDLSRQNQSRQVIKYRQIFAQSPSPKGMYGKLSHIVDVSHHASFCRIYHSKTCMQYWLQATFKLHRSVTSVMRYLHPHGLVCFVVRAFDVRGFVVDLCTTHLFNGITAMIAASTFHNGVNMSTHSASGAVSNL